MLPTTVRTRTGLAVAAVVAPLLAGVALTPSLAPLVALPAAVATAGAIAALTLGTRWAAPAAGTVSLLATVAVRVRGGYPVGASAASSAALVEVAALLLLTVLAVRARQGPRQGLAVLPAGLAASCWFLRFGAPGESALSAIGFWVVITLLAAACGGYLRALDQARARSVAGARRSQRLELARDLHDFVAHDVSEMLALAQAGRFVTEADGPAAEMFERIEHAAQQALAAMDRTVHMLHDEPPHDRSARSARSATSAASTVPGRRPQPTLADLPELADRFAAAQGTAVRLDVDEQFAERLPREISATAYRVAVESLTNVRRHAPGTGAVQLTVRRATGPALEIVVSNQAGAAGGAPAARERSGGLGLVQLTERVEALGGTLTAGPLVPGGWRTSAVLPVRR